MNIDWTKAGNKTNIQHSNVVALSTFGVVGDGVTDNYQILKDAIASFKGEPVTLVFPKGNFLIKGSIAIPSNVVIRGAGSSTSMLKFNLNKLPEPCFSIGTSQGNTFTVINEGFTKGSDSIVVSSALGFKAGDVI